MLTWNNPPKDLFNSLGLSVVPQFSTVNPVVKKRNFETSNSKSGPAGHVAPFPPGTQRESPSLGSNFCWAEKLEFWDVQKRLRGSLNKFSAPVPMSSCKKAHRVWVPMNRRGRWNGVTHWLDLYGSKGLANCLVSFIELLLEISPHPLPPPLLVLPLWPAAALT